MTTPPNTPRHIIPQLDHGKRYRTRGVVIHVMDGPTIGGCIAWWSRRGNKVGAHLMVDNARCVQAVDLDHVAWHAPGDNMADPGAQSGNYEFIGIEHTGFGTDSYVRWIARRKQRVISANRTAWILYHYRCGVPKWGHNVVRHSEFSRTTHKNCPGKGFPVKLYMMAVNRAYRNLVKSRGKSWSR